MPPKIRAPFYFRARVSPNPVLFLGGDRFGRKISCFMGLVCLNITHALSNTLYSSPPSPSIFSNRCCNRKRERERREKSSRKRRREGGRCRAYFENQHPLPPFSLSIDKWRFSRRCLRQWQFIKRRGEKREMSEWDQGGGELGKRGASPDPRKQKRDSCIRLQGRERLCQMSLRTACLHWLFLACMVVRSFVRSPEAFISSFPFPFE